MKKLALCLLVLINLALALALATTGGSSEAEAQVRGGSGGFTSITMPVGTDDDIHMLIDNRSNLLFGILIDDARRDMVMRAVDVRDLTSDFRVREDKD